MPDVHTVITANETVYLIELEIFQWINPYISPEIVLPIGYKPTQSPPSLTRPASFATAMMTTKFEPKRSPSAISESNSDFTYGIARIPRV